MQRTAAAAPERDTRETVAENAVKNAAKNVTTNVATTTATSPATIAALKAQADTATPAAATAAASGREPARMAAPHWRNAEETAFLDQMSSAVNSGAIALSPDPAPLTAAALKACGARLYRARLASLATASAE